MKIYDSKLSTEQFQVYLEDRLNKIRSVLGSKGAEYAVDDDRMHNFNLALAVAPNYKSREEAIFGMMLKHWVSILDIIDNTKRSIIPTDYLINEKFGDMINYLILMEISLRQSRDYITEVDNEELPF